MVMVHSACLFKFRYIVFKFRHTNGEFTRRFGQKKGGSMVAAYIRYPVREPDGTFERDRLQARTVLRRRSEFPCRPTLIACPR